MGLQEVGSLSGAGQDGLPGGGETQKALDAEEMKQGDREGTETWADPWRPALLSPRPLDKGKFG